MSEARTHRLEAEIQRTLAALIAREVKDPRVGNVTITAVQVAPDMGSARVYFTPFASQAPAEQVAHGLARAASFLRGQLGRRLSLRHAPRLEFVFDATAEGAARLTSLIDRAVAADRAGHGAAGGAAGGEEGEGGEDVGGAGSGGPGSGDPAS
ncbi:MAG TPA: 30S ribosome-binding factor RbfA [Steroidobacteraceae bacterium]|nr:30S ribosome-binding factor RbfA [Steroidobacteraceae bacterium]